MANLSVIAFGIALVIVGLALFLGSFLFVDENGQFATGAFGLFLGGIFGICLGGLIIYRGIDDS